MPSPKPHLKCDKCGKASYTKRCAKCMTADNKKKEEKKKEYEYITVKGKRMRVEKKVKKAAPKKATPKKAAPKKAAKSKTFLYKGKKYSEEEIEAMRAKKPKRAPPPPPSEKKKELKPKDPTKKDPPKKPLGKKPTGAAVKKIRKVIKDARKGKKSFHTNLLEDIQEEPEEDKSKKKKIIKKKKPEPKKKVEPKKKPEAPKPKPEPKKKKIVKKSLPSEPVINKGDSEAVIKEKKRRVARLRETAKRKEKAQKSKLKTAQTSAALDPKKIIVKAKKQKERLGKVQDFLLDVKMSPKDKTWFENFNERLNEDEEDFDFDYSKLMRMKNKYITQAKKKEGGSKESPVVKKKKIIKKAATKAPPPPPPPAEPIDYLEDEHFLKGVGMPLEGPDITSEAWEESMNISPFPPPPPQATPAVKQAPTILTKAAPKAAAPKAAAAEEAPKKKLIDSFSKDEKVKELFRKSYPEAKKKEQRTIYGKLRNVFNMLKSESISEKEAKEEELKPKEIDLFFYMVNNNMFMGAEEYVKKRNEQRKTKDKADEEFRQAQIKAGQRYE